MEINYHLRSHIFMNNTLIKSGLVALVIIIIGYISLPSKDSQVPAPLPISGASSTPVSEAPGQSHSKLPYGEVTLKLAELATFEDVSIRPISIVEDSRCPEDVECIQAGTVRVNIEITSGAGSSTEILKLEEPFALEGKMITLRNVTPNTNSQTELGDEDYRLLFTVEAPRQAEAPSTKGKCYIGGCSSQVCSDREDIASTCEYKESYACYKSATCERQPSGECGWTDSPALSSCLKSSLDTSAI